MTDGAAARRANWLGSRTVSLATDIVSSQNTIPLPVLCN